MAINTISSYPTIGPGNYNESTGTWEYGNPMDPESGFRYDEGAGSYTKLDPNYSVPSDLTVNDIKNGVAYALDNTNPWNPRVVADPYGQAPADKNAYYNDLATTLANQAFNESAINGDPSRFTNLLEGIKEVDPKAYYTGQIDYLSRQAGQYAIGKPGQEAQFNQQIQALLPEAMKYGVTPEEINSIYGSGYGQGGQTMNTIIANGKENGGGFLQPLIEGAKIIAPAALGMYGLDMALGAGLAGAGALDSTAIALGGGGGGFIPTAGSSFSLIPGAAYTTAGLTGLGEGASSVADILGSTGFTPTTGSSFAIDPSAAYTTANIPSYVTGSQMGPTYGELGVTGVPEGGMGPTYGEMGYTGLNQGEAIAAADAASQGMSTSDILSNANRLKTGANTLAKLLGGSSTSNATGSTGVNAQQLASLLGAGLPTQSAPGGLYRMNQNPFNFGTQGQTPVSQGMYDVSGTNPMANALRKA